MNADTHQHQDTSCLTCRIVVISVILGLVVFAYRQSQFARYFMRMGAYYLSILATAFITCFVTPVTYFFDMGCMPVLIIFRFICSFWMDLEIEVRGIDNIRKASGKEDQPLVLISNHQSSLDIYTMASVWPNKCTALIKSSLKYIPFFNLSAFFSHIIFVNKYVPEEAHKAIEATVYAMKKRKMSIWIFPEGTRNHQIGMLSFKKGAFNIAIEGKYTIIPIVISSYAKFYSKSQHYFRSKGKIIVQVLDPVTTNDLTRDDVPALCERVRNDMLAVYTKISNIKS